jgi:hypothetical protein
MNISQKDALLNALLASPARTPKVLATFIYTQYREYCEAAARDVIKKKYPAIHAPLLVAEAAAEKVIEYETRKALDGTFSFKGAARYSTYLYTAIKRQIPRALSKNIIVVDPARSGRILVESEPQEGLDSSSLGRAGGDAVLAQAYRTALLEGLNECMAKLEPLEEKLATFVYVRGLTPTEACRRLGLRSPSYTWKHLQDKLRPLLERHDLPSLYAGYRELCE